MNDLVREVAVAETKGLLKKIDSIIVDSEYNLGFDNLDNLPTTIDRVRRMLDVIENKVGMFRSTENDELY